MADNDGLSLGDTLSGDDLEAVYDVSVDVIAVLGNAPMDVGQLLKLGRGAVVVLDRGVEDTIDIKVNGQLVAKGEVVVVEDHLGVRLTDILRRSNNK